MKILYGVQGTGNGHIARARVMAKALAQRDEVEVDFLFSGREQSKYFDMEVFGDYQTLSGLTFVTEKGAVNQWKTLRSAKIRQFFKDIRQLDVRSYDLVLNDFEPVSAWAAKNQDVSCISVSHQAAFSYPVPKTGANFIDNLLTRYFAPSDIQLGVHWYHFGHSIMPPFIEEQLDVTPSNQHIVVYLPFEDLDEIAALLTQFKDTAFLCFHPEIRTETIDKNIHWQPTSKPKFQHALKHCNGVIANGGFELSSECLQLGKKLLIKPLKGQYEQSSNVLTLEKLGLCSSMSNLAPDAIKAWLDKTPPDPVTFPDKPDIFIDWILNEDWYDTRSICEQLWKQVVFPPAVKQKLSTLASGYAIN